MSQTILVSAAPVTAATLDKPDLGRTGHAAGTARPYQDDAALAVGAVARALDTFQRGGFVIVFDRESRENEGDLMIAAEHCDADALRFLLDHTCGVVCVALSPERADALALPPMTEPNTGLHDTAFTVSVDLAYGTTTGISVADRSATIRALAAPQTRPADLARPGHVFPIRAAAGGVLARDGHTEAGVDLSLLSGMSGATVICEVVRPDWSMARLDDLRTLAARYDLPLISVQDLIDYRVTDAYSA